MALNTLNLFSNSPAFVMPVWNLQFRADNSYFCDSQLELRFCVWFCFVFSSSHRELTCLLPGDRRDFCWPQFTLLKQLQRVAACPFEVHPGSPKENESAHLLTRPASLVKVFPVVSLWRSNKSVRNLILLPCCSVAQSCPTLCEPMDCSTPGFSVLHHLLELAHIHVRLFSQIWPQLLWLLNDFPTLI